MATRIMVPLVNHVMQIAALVMTSIGINAILVLSLLGHGHLRIQIRVTLHAEMEYVMIGRSVMTETQLL